MTHYVTYIQYQSKVLIARNLSKLVEITEITSHIDLIFLSVVFFAPYILFSAQPVYESFNNKKGQVPRSGI